MYTNRDSCEVVKRKTRPFKDTKCADCGFKYPSRKELILHRKKAHPVKYKCPTKTFKRLAATYRHTGRRRGSHALSVPTVPTGHTDSDTTYSSAMPSHR